MISADVAAPRAGHKVIRLGSNGAPWLEAYRCAACGAVVPDATLACRRCASRTPPQGFRVGLGGRLHSWSVVYRSYPGIAVPFVSAIVDLDDGLVLKGTLKGVAASALREGLAVQVVFDDAGGACDAEGAPYVGFHFAEQGIAA